MKRLEDALVRKGWQQLFKEKMSQLVWTCTKG